MKTRVVPSICMLAAGLIRCIAGAIYQEELKSFLWSLILVMVLFYLFGIVIRFVLDRNIKEMLVEEENQEEEDIELENIEESQPEDLAEGENVSVKEKDSEQMRQE